MRLTLSILLLIPWPLLAATPIGPRTDRVFNTLSEVTNRVLVPYETFTVLGRTTPGDMPPMRLQYDPTATENPNGISVLATTNGIGRVKGKWDGNVLNAGAVADYDTVGEEGTDNYAAFTNAIHTSWLAADRKVLIPAGDYRLTQPIVIDDHTTDIAEQRYYTIEGPNFGSVRLFIDHDGPAFIIQAREVRMRNLIIESTSARRANPWTSHTNGCGILTLRSGSGSSHGRVVLEAVRVFRQPGNGVTIFGAELHRHVDCDYDSNGGYGLAMIPLGAAGGGFVNRFENCRATFNAKGGLYLDTVSYGIFDPVEVYSNGGPAQIWGTNLNTCIFIAPDLENQPNNTAVRSNTFTDLTFSAETRSITSAGIDFQAAGWAVTNYLLVTGTADADALSPGVVGNDRAYTISNIVGNVIYVNEPVTDETPASVGLAESTSNWGMILTGQKVQVHGGHFSGLVGGILIGQHSDGFFLHPRTANTSGDLTMPVAIHLQHISSRGNVIYGGQAGQTRVFHRWRDDSTLKENQYWRGNQLDTPLAVLGTLTTSNLFRSAGDFYAQGNAVVSNGFTVYGIMTNRGGSQGKMVGSDRLESDTNKTFRLVTPTFAGTNEVLGIRQANSETVNRVTIGGGTANAVAATAIGLFSATNLNTATGLEIARVTSGGMRIQPDGVGADIATGIALDIVTTNYGARSIPVMTRAQAYHFATNLSVKPEGMATFWTDDDDYGPRWWSNSENDWVNPFPGTGTGITLEEVQDSIGGGFLVAGAGISLTYADGGNTLTISNTASGGGVTLEEVQDNLGTSFLVPTGALGGNYDDGTDTYSLDVQSGGIAHAMLGTSVWRHLADDLDFGELMDGASESINISAAGVVADDYALLGFPYLNNDPDLPLYVWCVGDNVTVTVINRTGGTVNPTEETVRAVVLKAPPP